MIRGALLALALAAAPVPGAAAEWVVDDARSDLRFDYVANGLPGEGRFARFSGVGRFDPERPGESELRLEIDVRGLDMGDPIRQAFALGPDWFDVAEHPTARFELDEALPLPVPEGAPQRFVAKGRLTLKGVTRPVRVPVVREIGAEEVRAPGSAAFRPGDFGIGEGRSARLVTVRTPVTVQFDIVAGKAAP